MKPVYHGLISGAFSIVLLVWFNSWHMALTCFLGGIFIDLDHHIDYFLAKKEIPLSYTKLFNFGAYDKHAKLYLFFHTYEALIFFWLAIYYFHLNDLWLGLAVGLTTHMICDQFANPLRPLGYFLIYRLKHGFERKYILKEDYYAQIN